MAGKLAEAKFALRTLPPTRCGRAGEELFCPLVVGVCHSRENGNPSVTGGPLASFRSQGLYYGGVEGSRK